MKTFHIISLRHRPVLDLRDYDDSAETDNKCPLQFRRLLKDDEGGHSIYREWKGKKTRTRKRTRNASEQ